MIAGAVVVSTPSALATADVLRGMSMLARFSVPVLALVENMASFSTRCPGCGEEHEHFPFGQGHLDAVLESMRDRDRNVPCFRLPIIGAQVNHGTSGTETSPLHQHIDRLAQSLEQVIPSDAGPMIEFPQLAWHERPSWADKLFFGSQRTGIKRRHHEDSKFIITPPD